VRDANPGLARVELAAVGNRIEDMAGPSYTAGLLSGCRKGLQLCTRECTGRCVTNP
jgi:hypothetical protein